MVERSSSIEHRKRKRRKWTPRPVSVWVQPSEELRGSKVRISHQLWAELYRHREIDGDAFVGIAPWTPSQGIEDHTWTVVPVQGTQDETGPDFVQVSTHSPALCQLLDKLEVNPFSHNGKRRDRFEARLVSVQPLPLEKIYVSVDGDALEQYVQEQQRFRGGFVDKRKQKAVKNGQQGMGVDEELIQAIREALRSSVVARQGDPLPLPLATHPITHVAFPPAQILLCEPVAQGLPTSDTRIFVNSNLSQWPRPVNRPLPVMSHSKSLTDFDNTDGEAFHSAVEDDEWSGDGLNEAEDSDSAEDDAGSSSSDSSDEIITMSTPAVPLGRPSMMSSRATATPRGYARRANGISTPGSVFSNMTSMTTRREQSKQFKAHPLQFKVPAELLQPPPDSQDDDETRVFVDMKVLVRLGCFSGDWVTIKPVASDNLQGRILSSLNTESDSRPAKLFGLSDLSTHAGPLPPLDKSRSRRASVFSSAGAVTGTLNAWLSPNLLANLGGPELVKITVLQDAMPERPSSRSRAGGRKIDVGALPPTAQEMTLTKILTPVSTEKALQNGIFAVLKQYFASKRRIVKKGDKIAIPLDVQSSRLFADHASNMEDELDELLLCQDRRGTESTYDITWYKVDSIIGPEPLEASDLNSSMWCGAFCIEHNGTRMRQAGSEQCKTVPRSVDMIRYLVHTLPIGANPVHQIFAPPLLSPHVSPVQRRIRELMGAATSPRAITLNMDPVIILLHSNQRNVGKATLAQQAATDVGLHTFGIDAYDLLADGPGGSDVKTEALFKARIERALASGAAFTSVLVRHIEALTADRMSAAFREAIQDVRILIATTSGVDNVTDDIRNLFTHEIEVSPPDEGERERLLRSIIQKKSIKLSQDVDLASIALKTAALVAGNLVDIVERAVIARRTRLDDMAYDVDSKASSAASAVSDVLIAGGDSIRCVTKADFDIAVESARKSFADSIGAPKIPNVLWKDVGGLSHIKAALQETIELPLSRPELFAKGLKKRSGMLFYGPPGTGKTLVAKAIATEFSLNFFSVKGPELLNMYIGESEANVRRVFQRARDARPCVVFFDELDSVAPKRGNQGDSGGVMDRIVSQLLAELDGMSDSSEGSGSVFVIGATNRPDLLDPALLRPGRFDKMLYLGVSDTHEKQLMVLQALTRKFTMHPDLELRRVAEALPFTFTGADLYALCSDAMLKAITRQAEAVDEKIAALNTREGRSVSHAWFFDHLASDEDIAVMVTAEDFLAAAKELVPSVSAKELDHYKNIQREFDGSDKGPVENGTANTNSSLMPNGHMKPQMRRLKSSKQHQNVSTDASRSSSKSKGKGKGKATTWDSDDDDDDGFVTSNDYATPEPRKSHN